MHLEKVLAKKKFLVDSVIGINKEGTHMKKKKKGAIALYALFIIIGLLVFASIMVNVTQGMQMVTRMNQAAEEGAKVRAQAVDTLLKEQEGIIEVLHGSIDYNDNVKHADHTDVAGHKNPSLPQNSEYQESKKKADEVARKSTIDFIKNSIYNDIKQKKQMVQVSEKDICFDFKPLPDDSLYQEFDPEKADPKELKKTYKIDFSCTTPNGDTIKAKNVKVSGVKGNTVKISDKNGKIETIKSANVVFVGIKFKYSYFINQTIENFGLSSTSEGEVWAVAYPQADKCVRSEATCTY